MKSLRFTTFLGCWSLSIVALCGGCHHLHAVRAIYNPPPTPPTLGTISDSIWKLQENGAEGADFIIYQHEFESNGTRLNKGGEDHLQQIAVRLLSGQDFPVIIEQSSTSVKEGTEFEYPIHPNPELDLERREITVRLLTAMGVQDADKRTLVAPSYAMDYRAIEAIRAYQIGYTGQTLGYGGGFFSPFGFGGNFGGFGGFGGFGFGGGFFGF